MGYNYVISILEEELYETLSSLSLDHQIVKEHIAELKRVISILGELS